MNSSPVEIDIHLDPQTIWRKTLGKGERVCFRSYCGTSWITMDNDAQDHFLRAGESLILHGPGQVIIEGVDVTDISADTTEVIEVA